MMVGHTKSSSALWKWKRSSRQTIKREELAAAIATTLPTEPAPPQKKTKGTLRLAQNYDVWHLVISLKQ